MFFRYKVMAAAFIMLVSISALPILYVPVPGCESAVERSKNIDCLIDDRSGVELTPGAVAIYDVNFNGADFGSRGIRSLVRNIFVGLGLSAAVFATKSPWRRRLEQQNKRRRPDKL